MSRKIEDKKVNAGDEQTTEEIVETLRFLRQELRESYNIPERT